MSALNELRAGPSEEQKRHKEAARAQLVRMGVHGERGGGHMKGGRASGRLMHFGVGVHAVGVSLGLMHARLRPTYAGPCKCV